MKPKNESENYAFKTIIMIVWLRPKKIRICERLRSNCKTWLNNNFSPEIYK